MAAPRASWKGNLRLSLVTCPIELFPATSEKDKVNFNQLNRQHRQSDHTKRSTR
jgi:DNA end-binding protein Ku